MNVRTKTLLAFAFAGGLLPGAAAHAQLLDTLLPPAIPGYGQKFSVIAERRQFAPGATGWNFGSVTAAPSLGVQAGYDSAPGGAAGSPVLAASPSLLLADPVAGFGLYASASTAAYPQNHEQNSATLLLAGGERIALPRETILASAAFLHAAVTGFAFSTTQITKPVPFTLQNLRLSDKISAGLFTLTPDVSLAHYDFGASAAAADRNELRETATLAYVPGGPLTALLRLGATQLAYHQSTQNADIYELLAGAEEQENGLWTLSFLAGLAQRQPRTGPGITAPVLEARADWMPTMLTKISLTASREIDDPDAISTTPYIQTGAQLAISQKYLTNFTCRASVDLAAAQYIHTDLHEILASGEVDVQWQATPAVALTSRYRFNTRQANTLDAVNEHIITLGIIWTP